VASAWQNKLARLSRTEWDEARVRLGQELHKRRDLLLHRLGRPSGSIPLRTDLTEGPGQYFFSDHEIPERVDLVRVHLSDEATGILSAADEICEHRLRLLGYEPLDYGADKAKEIDWHLDRVHGKRAPLDPWFKIPFLDFSAVGDHKVIWELNRHQHLVTLAKASLLSGNEKYARELMAQWRGWMRANPYPLGINWGSTLEVAFRALSWIWLDHLLAGVAECAEFRAEMAPALAFHGRYLERFLSTYFSPNTHLLGEAVAMFFLGTLYPRMPGAARWKHSGWQIVVREAGRQIRPDGVYFEQSLHYHVYALDLLLHARLLAARNGIEVPAAYEAVLGRMLDVVEALSQAGPAEGFGDDDGGRLFNPRRNRTEEMTDPLALGAVMFAKDFSAARLTEEAIWLLGRQAVDKLAGRSPSPALASVAFADGGIYVMADSQPYAQAMAADTGPQGSGRSGHGHADALSLRFTMDGRRWLVDSGSGVYISKDPADRDTFRGTGAHNTLRVDGMDQAVMDGPFSWTSMPITRSENWLVGKSFRYLVGSHNGYARLAAPVLHRRYVLNVGDGVWLIRDVALGGAEHELEIRWHFASDLEVQANGAGTVKVSPVGAGSGDASLVLITPDETNWHTEVSRTLLSPAYGALRPAPLVRCHSRVLLPAETSTALVARSGANRQQDQFRMAAMTQAAVQVYELEYDEESHGFFFALGDEGWSFGPWSSDAQVLYCRIDNERLMHLVVIGGSYAAWQGQPLLKMAQAAAFFEWRKHEPVFHAQGGEVVVTPWFERLTSSRSSAPFAEKH
jgi:hypothetical protein